MFWEVWNVFRRLECFDWFGMFLEVWNVLRSLDCFAKYGMFCEGWRCPGSVAFWSDLVLGIILGPCTIVANKAKKLFPESRAPVVKLRPG